ncbi:MAG: hypothetical protein NPINA01_24610 [Nitrospinaceae bacterium]|nr:MAG: hypothetical protein NPINA01_24610 [Nitrospinaceae bacterium]
MKTLQTNKTLQALITLLWVPGWLFVLQIAVHAQGQVQLTHQVTAIAPVKGNNFVNARKQAVALGFQSALEKALRGFMGEESFEASQKEFSKILTHADRYVQSYRFIEAVDDPLEKTSEVILEVTLFPDALGKSLSHIGVVTKPENLKNVVILISENSITSEGEEDFWETTPISGAALVQNFTEAGVRVVPRDSILNNVPEETVWNAVKGNVNDAVQIGLKSGVDIVILGNAVSRKLARESGSGESTIQTNISVRVISALKSEVVAAKSDFATARNQDELAGELEAFGEVSRKLSVFLLSSLSRYWEAPLASQEFKPSSPAPAAPLPLEDL